MKYLKYIILLSLFVICSCDTNAFIAKVEIDPKIDSVAGDITITYKLGDLLVLDEWESSKVNSAEMLYLINGEPERIILTVTAGDFNGVAFDYVVDGSIKVKTNPIKWGDIVRNIDAFDTVIWTTKDGTIINEKNQVPVVNTENKEEVKPESKGSKL